ncbi:hypothetical protein BAVI_23674 [Neobacillus vireti LMG 21834]|uniref:N-acetyltransferase domain-containing protein n=1 Tax=Neobacillus vireti LMG 21834 TaxID=1131730 RepID=A0AB94IGK2_9BACI|nr:hypothetical protein BAVI_23674 [Neobacillus vireti LMG 21834]
MLLTHTFVDSSLRGQGVAEQLVDCVVAEMKAEGKKSSLFVRLQLLYLKENPTNIRMSLQTKKGA